MRVIRMNRNIEFLMSRVRLWFQRIGHSFVRSEDVKRMSFIARARSATFVITMLATAVAAVSSLAASGNEASLKETAASLFPRLPKDAGTAEYPVTPERVRLGRMLFFDPRMSDDGTVSCSRCHQPSLYATDAPPKSVGVHGRPAARNAPTVFNAALHTTEHWDGRFKNVEEQAKRGLIGPAFGNPDFPTAMARIKAISGYTALFREAFPGEAEPINEANWGKAIGADQRT